MVTEAEHFKALAKEMAERRDLGTAEYHETLCASRMWDESPDLFDGDDPAPCDCRGGELVEAVIAAYIGGTDA